MTTSIDWNRNWDLSPAFVPKQRYLSPEFARYEAERLWPRVWQVACREDELEELGAFVEYTIGHESILVVRSGTDELKAFFNACRHRGRRLAEGSGRFEGRTITCPTHGWCWKLDGQCSFVMDREEFREEHVDPQRLRLVECRLETWAGFVWIHMDPHAEPLADYLASLSELLAPFELERTHPIFHKRVVLNANWKTTLDTFNEGYHALAIHPETRSVSTDNADASYFQVENGHSYYTYAPDMLERSAQRLGIDERQHFASSIAFLVDELRGVYVERDRHIAAGLADREVPVGSSVGLEFGRLQAEHAAGAGIRLPALSAQSAEHILGVHFVFPNFMVLPGAGSALFYRARPLGDDPDRSIFEIWSTRTWGREEGRPPSECRDLEPDDREGWGLVPYQDLSNLEAAHAGMYSRGFDGLALNTRQEMGVFHMHQEMDRVMRA
ncbi:MAG: aromatic ring-hydroxylating dioxygenase subunit alpha [Deltaproteobacteria bacterium]|nr:aromatic ring-hydroxylating dioxygenase subunit alpha [Deltaproteobacteria bacterium]